MRTRRDGLSSVRCHHGWAAYQPIVQEESACGYAVDIGWPQGSCRVRRSLALDFDVESSETIGGRVVPAVRLSVGSFRVLDAHLNPLS